VQVLVLIAERCRSCISRRFSAWTLPRAVLSHEELFIGIQWDVGEKTPTEI